MRVKEITIGLLPLIISIILITILVYYPVNFFERKTITDALTDIEPVFLAIIFSLIVLFFFANFKDIKKVFNKIKVSTWIIIILIALLGFSLRFFAAPQTHRVFFDEDIYQDIGKEILIHGKGSLCNYGNQTDCYEYDFMKWPNGYPFLIALSYLFFGISENVAFNLVNLLSNLSVLLIFLISYMLLRNEKIALYSAFLFSLISMHIVWSNTAASEPVLIFFTLLTIFFFLLSFKINNWKVSALAIFSLAYAVQIKAEAIIILPMILIMAFFFDKKFWKKISDYKFYSLWIILFILIIPYLIHICQAYKYDSWDSSGEKFGIEYAKKNIPENLWFWVFGHPTIEHPTLFTIFALIGLIYLLKQKKRSGLFLSIWFLIFFFLYAFFYAGSILYGVNVRYSLSEYPPFVILGGYGLYLLTKIRIKYERPVSIILISIILILFYFLYLPSISTPADKIQEARQARLYHDFVLREAKNFDRSCYILTHVPSMYLVNGNNALQTWFGSNVKVMNELFNKTDCIIFDYGFWCNLEPYKSSICKPMFVNYDLTAISSIDVDNHNYTLYRVSINMKNMKNRNRNTEIFI